MSGRNETLDVIVQLLVALRLTIHAKGTPRNSGGARPHSLFHIDVFSKFVKKILIIHERFWKDNSAA